MSKTLLVGLISAAILTAGPAPAQNVLQGDIRHDPNSNPSERVIDLFRGDLGAEIGIGCSNPDGTSGGPNDVAVRVTSPLPTPFNIISHFYNIDTVLSPTITSLTFSVWGAGAIPGGVIGTQPGLDFAFGNHTIAIQPPIAVNSVQFFFGHMQPQTSAGIRWGLDTSSGGGTDSFIRAPACDAPDWATLTSIGFAGNWVMSVTIDDAGPTPIELATWGQVKKLWQ